ncbi:MAG: Serine/threonine-protein kinase HipA [Tenericutes bacterium ADurb.BinA124]|nr:MAG: Serine/threonine-protein kinase HipA [Tenericutes bacterium ADurb.BinA124]
MSAFRKADVYIRDCFAGVLEETDEGYAFSYDFAYIKSENVVPVSLTLPLQNESFTSKTLFSFFDGLIPEGWLLNVVTSNWKIPKNDRFAILLVACKDPIGNVSIQEKRI